MSVYLPGSHDWLANGWISRNFFRDAVAAASGASDLISEIAGLVQTGAKTLDLEDRDPSVVREFLGLVETALSYNEQTAGANFAQPEFFPVYLDHLRRLKQEVEDSLSGKPAPASPQT